MKQNKNQEEKSSVFKDYFMGIIFLIIPIVIIYLFIKLA
jgi:hypothetical protein